MTKAHPDLDVTKDKDPVLHPLAEAFVIAKEEKMDADQVYNAARDELSVAMHAAGRTEYFCSGVEIEGHEVFIIKGKKIKTPGGDDPED